MQKKDYSWSGILEPLLIDEAVTSITIKDIHSVWIQKCLNTSLASVSFSSRDELQILIKDIIDFYKADIEKFEPLCHFKTADGLLFHFVLPPVSGQIMITITKFKNPLYDILVIPPAEAVNKKVPISHKKSFRK